MMEIVHVELVRAPSDSDWMWVKECAVGTEIGKKAIKPPTSEWKKRMLKARHSPIRELTYSFVLTDIPYWVSVHLVRHHVGFNCYVQSQRNDRQKLYDRNSARQDTPITMRITVNAEELMTIANKRLCNLASEETRDIVKLMCVLAEAHTPEFNGLLVPMCERLHGHCEEFRSCGKYIEYEGD